MEANTSRNLLNPDELLTYDYLPVRWQKRLCTYLLDLVFFYVLILTLSFVVALFAPQLLSVFIDGDPILDRVLSLLLYVGYYVLFEGWLGKTPGKMVMKTKVVDENGDKPSFGKVLTRSFSRLVPLDAFSFIADTPMGWHDRWAGTMVVADEPVSLDRTLAKINVN